MSAMLDWAGFQPLLAGKLAGLLRPGACFAKPLDFQEFAETLGACLERGRSTNFTRWLDAVDTVPPDIREFLWLVVDTTLSDRAKASLGRQFSGSAIHRSLQRYRFERPPGGDHLFQTEKQEFDAYEAIFKKFGSEDARRDLCFGRTVMLALRTESSTLAHHGEGSYDDLLVVMRRIGEGRQLSTFPLCTEPGAQYSQRAQSGRRHDKRYDGVSFNQVEGIDINNDGIRDAGRLVAGTYHYFEKEKGHNGDRAFKVTTAQVTERDTNGDGRFTSADPSRIDLTGAQNTMYIHQGGRDNRSEPDTESAGCQTVPRNEYKTFLKRVPASGSFYYVLVQAR